MAGGHKIDPSLQGPVSEQLFMLVLWIFWFLALIALAVRITMYIRARRRPQVDDCFLMLSVACLTVATLWMQTRYGDAYEVIALSIDPFKAGIPIDLNHVIYRAQLAGYVYGPMIWTAIFAAKWAYLWFFKQLVHNVRSMVIWWWFVFGFTIAVWPVCVVGVYIACPHMDFSAFKCNQDPLITRALNVAIVSVSLDIATDLLILTIPVWLLWRVRCRLAQKASLACFLCLSIVMVVLAIIRVSPLRVGEHPNLAVHAIWINMLGQVEACVAVCLVSLSAFRYFFVMQGRRRHEEEERRRAWFRPNLDRFRPNRRRLASEEDGMETLPQIPSATLSGLRTFIRNAAGGVRTSTTVTTTTQTTIIAPETVLGKEASHT